MDIDTKRLRELLDLDRLACSLCGAFWAHGDNNEAAMRSALTELGIPGYLAELSALRARVEAAPVRQCVEAVADSMWLELESGDVAEFARAGDYYRLLEEPRDDGR